MTIETLADTLHQLCVDDGSTKFVDDILKAARAALAVVQEEVGELQKAVLKLSYEPGKASPEDVRDEAVQVAAMALRFLASLNEYRFGPVPQHRQKVGCAACDRGDLQLGHADGCAENVAGEATAKGNL